MSEPINLDDIPKGQWVKVDAEQVADLLTQSVQRDLAGLYELLGESPEAWRGAAFLASGLFHDLHDASKSGQPTTSLLMRMGAMLHSFLDHPLASGQINKWIAEHPEANADG